ncbi:hypothetical protein PIB30_054768 [Stylosanthes scabra]|uniref:Amidohydrolase-related domain-containing protein n=1 Tax=Stylosanthes scabra TaxID=79078 RepID=A0ABU6YGB0_9FABA|nr:hypothetical protein [Stylosanthes scabra]
MTLFALFYVCEIRCPCQSFKRETPLLSQIVSSFGANRVMWGSDSSYVVPECGYKEGKEAVNLIANKVFLSPSDLI